MHKGRLKNIAPQTVEGYMGLRIDLVCASCDDSFSVTDTDYERLHPTECHAAKKAAREEVR